MVTVLNPLRTLLFAFSLSASALTALSCHAQLPPTGTPLSLETARRVEVLIRSKSNIPPNYVIQISGRAKSEFPGYDEITVIFTADGQSSRPTRFLISTDNKTLAQLSSYDISKDPKELVSAAGRPFRGGPKDAPVLIVLFDDLECPFCAKMHAQLFPALTNRYKDQVHIVYRDFPLDQHPWALRAAIDSNCLAAASPNGYWTMVDYIHTHAAEFGGADHSLAKANEALDNLAIAQGKTDKVKAEPLAACIAKQDSTAIMASRKEAEALGVEATPALFINGERVEGALPIEYIYRVIDSALVAAGKTPPPPVPVPPLSAAQPAAPGN